MSRAKKPDAANMSGDEFHDLPPIAGRAIFEFERGQGRSNSHRAQEARENAEAKRVAYESALCVLREAEQRDTEDREAFAASLAREVNITTFGMKCLVHEQREAPAARAPVTPQENLERVRELLERKRTPKAKGQGLSRTTRVNPVNRERKEKLNAAAFGPCARLSRLTPCCVPGCKATPPGDPCHVRSRGAGGKDWGNVVPMCRRHHSEQGDIGVPAFEDRHKIHLDVVAGFIAEAVRDHSCESWAERTKAGTRCAVCLKPCDAPVGP